MNPFGCTKSTFPGFLAEILAIAALFMDHHSSTRSRHHFQVDHFRLKYSARDDKVVVYDGTYKNSIQTLIATRMHSSRMRTVRCSSHLAGGGTGGRGVCQRVSAQVGVSTQGECLPRGVCQTPP